VNEEHLEQIKFESSADYLAALDNICRLASHTLIFFDKDFVDSGFNSSSRFEILHNFLLISPKNELQFLAHDSRPLSQHCPRLLLLMRQFSHNMSIYQTPKHLQHLSAPFAIADNLHYVRRFHFDHPQGVFTKNDGEYAHLLKSRFIEMRQASHPSSFTATFTL
jgi:hypothetical protein